MKDGFVIPKEVEERAERFAKNVTDSITEYRREARRQREAASAFMLILSTFSKMKSNEDLDRGSSRTRRSS